jgi:putative YphP/YqiW family bacilliredoxin
VSNQPINKVYLHIRDASIQVRYKWTAWAPDSGNESLANARRAALAVSAGPGPQPYRRLTYNIGMPYPEFFVAPMRQELTDLGIQELRSAADVDAAVTGTAGTLMIVVNSVCGCAAGKARPGIALALRNAVKPAAVTTVFAGADIEATDRARHYFAGYRPSSPSIALIRDGQVIYMLERSQIENRDALAIASELTAAFEKFCAAPTPA